MLVVLVPSAPLWSRRLAWWQMSVARSPLAPPSFLSHSRYWAQPACHHRHASWPFWRPHRHRCYCYCCRHSRLSRSTFKCIIGGPTVIVRGQFVEGGVVLHGAIHSSEMTLFALTVMFGTVFREGKLVVTYPSLVITSQSHDPRIQFQQ